MFPPGDRQSSVRGRALAAYEGLSGSLPIANFPFWPRTGGEARLSWRNGELKILISPQAACIEHELIPHLSTIACWRQSELARQSRQLGKNNELEFGQGPLHLNAASSTEDSTVDI